MAASRTIRQIKAGFGEAQRRLGDWFHLPLAFLLGRLTLAGGSTPMAMALVASLPRSSPGWALLVVIPLGAYTRGGAAAAILSLLQIIILLTTRRLLPLPPAYRSVMGLLMAQIARGAWVLAASGWTPYQAWIWVLELVVVVALSGIMAHALGSDSGSGEEIRLSRLLILSLAASATAGWALGPTRLPMVLGSLLVLLSAPAGYGGQAGVLVGAAMGLGNLPSAFLIGYHAVSGLVAGSLYRWGKIACGLGYAATTLVMGLYAVSSPTLFPGWPEASAAVLIFLLLPGAVLGRASQAVGGELPVPDRLRSFADAFRELAHAFGEVAVARPPEGSGDPSRVVGRLVGEVCNDCKGYARCWKSSFHRTYTQILDLVAGEGRFPDWCQQKERLQIYLERRQEMARMQAIWSRRADAGRELMVGQLEAVATIVDELALRPQHNRDILALPRYCFTTARRSRARHGGSVSGDSTLVVEEGSTFMAAISDGMGSGHRAAMESGTALALMRRLHTCGLGHEMAIRAVNAVMLFRSHEELFATLDLMVADRVSGQCQFIKVGASPTFISREGQVFIVNSSSLPVGIMEDLDIQSSQRRLKEGDMVVMVSDGALAMGSQAGDLWLPRFLSRELPSPERLADDIMDASLRHTGGVPRDDMTVVVVEVRGRTG